MRYAIAAMLVLAGMCWRSEHAAAQPESQSTLVQIATYLAGGSSTVKRSFFCQGFDEVPLYVVAPNPDPDIIAISNSAVDINGAPAIEFDDLGRYRRAGHVVVITNRGANEFFGSAFIFCRKASSLTPAPFQRTIQPGPTNFFPLTCPTGQVPVGYVSNADGVNLEERSRVHLFGPTRTPPNALADGGYRGSEMALGLGMRNNTTEPRDLSGMALCERLLNWELNVTSTSVHAGQAFEAFAGIPVGLGFVNNSFAVSGTNRPTWRFG